jgi:apurinic endonuclease (APN1)
MHMLQETEYVDGNTFQFFTRNPRGGQAKAIDPADAAAFCRTAEEKKFAQILAHAPYTLNPCAEKESVREFTRNTMADDLARMESVPGNLYNFHPGSHVGQGVEAGIEMIAAMLNEILTPEQHTTVLLETMAGKGSEIGSRFEELREILDRVTLSDKLGVCLDTCHVYDAGYDIVGDLDGVLETFDAVIGLEKLKAIHINDSKNPYESHKDRHEKIGDGSIGKDAFRRIITHEKLRDLPFLLETPNDLDGYKAEIELLKELYYA